MDSRAKELIKIGDGLFSKKMMLNSLHQEIAENFYPERADFTATRFLGQDFASNLTTSYPIIIRRELHGLISGMLRPNDKPWFETSIFRDDRLDKAGKGWLEEATKTQRRAMYDRVTNLVRATRECDGDFVTFGQGVIQARLNKRTMALLYSSHHLRDCAWTENIEHAVATVHRKWKPSCLDLINTRASNPDMKLNRKITDSKNKSTDMVNMRHIVMPSEDYDTGSGPNGKRYRTPFVSIWVDVDNGEIVLEEASINLQYIVPRWQTVSGSQYAFSPCTVAGLPDARLLQDMTLTLLEAGQKAANPPMFAQKDVVKSDMNIYSGGVTWIDSEYDERLGAALRPMDMNLSGIPLGVDMSRDTREMLKEAFFLNKINMPPPADSRDMTAYEVGQRVQEYVRNALPLFEPMEMDYNGALCEITFDILMKNGAFGSVFDMPQSLRGQDIQFHFQSPLHDAIERQQGHTFLEAQAMIAQAVNLDPSAAAMIDVRKTLRDVLEGIGVPQKWQRSDEEMDAIQEQHAQQQQMQATAQNLNVAAQTAENIGAAGTALKSLQPQ